MQAACAGFLYASSPDRPTSPREPAAWRWSSVATATRASSIRTTSKPILCSATAPVRCCRPRPAGPGINGFSLGSDGGGGDCLSRPACGSRLPPTPELIAKGMHYMHMDGRAVFRWAVAILTDTILDVLEASNLRPQDVDLYIPHQANIRIINAAIDVLHIPRSKVFNNLDRYGNTSAGSVPLALDEAIAEGRLKPGQLAVLSGFEAGLAWGTTVIRW